MNNWISVETEMPPYLSRNIVSNGTYVRLAWSKDDDEGWCIIEPSQDEDEWLYDVTHWQPLPQPPSLTHSNEPGK